MVDPKLGLVIVLGGNVVRVELVLGVELMQHGGVRALWEPRSTHQALLLLPTPLSTRPYCLSCPLSFHPLLSFPRASLPLFISQYRSSLGLHFPICEVGELELQNLESTSQYRKSISQDSSQASIPSLTPRHILFLENLFYASGILESSSYGVKESHLPCPALPQAHLGELALLIDEGDDVHGFVGDHVQGILVVCELNVQPVNALQVILLLLHLEHVPHEELLQVLIGKVDAELLKAAGREQGTGWQQARGRGVQALPCHSGVTPAWCSVCPWDFQSPRWKHIVSPTSSMTEEGMEAQRGHSTHPRSLSETEES